MRCVVAFIAPVLVQGLEPFIPPISIPYYQASLPEVIDINYDVPAKGSTQNLASVKALSTSFLKKAGTTDVYFDNGNISNQESEYQAILKSVQSQIESRFQALLGSARGSFLQAPNVKIFVDNSAGKHVDTARLNADALAYAASRVASLESSSFLRLSGDVVPKPRPVLNIDIDTA